MAYIEFNDALRVGNKLIDQEHEELISYINLLDEAVKNEASSAIIAQVVTGMVEYTKTHFFVEEELMKVYEYPDIEFHLKAHKGFREQASGLLKSIEAKEEIDLVGVLDFLKTWLTGHILKIDAKLAAFLEGKSLA